VSIGDSVDFIVESQSGGYRDEFKWHVEVRYKDSSGAEDIWRSNRDFASQRELSVYRLMRERHGRLFTGEDKVVRGLKWFRETVRNLRKEEFGPRTPALSVPAVSGDSKKEAAGKSLPALEPPAKPSTPVRPN
jgi:hypothetical protein